MSRRHRYEVEVVWTGNRGSGTSSYTAYGRDHEVCAVGKPVIAGSTDPTFRGDTARWNPEELLVASLSACHKLWYLHLCVDAGVVVTAYEDRPEGLMIEENGGEGQFASVVLRPRVTITPDSDAELAERLHKTAHEKCFIARSVSFPVTHEAVIVGARAPVAP
jgi:organic hydroperoxide reductase OsmC/OhrA